MELTSDKVKEWRNGAKGFLQWLEDVQPRIPSSKGGFEVFKIADFQREAVTGALETDEKGNFRYQTIVFSFPRRHSKTILNALLVTWRFTNFITENIKVMANSERQTLSVGFSLVKKMLLNTPFLRSLVGERNIRAYDILYPKLHNVIEAVSCNPAGLYGEKITTGWVSEIHAAASDEPMQILASSLGDSANSWLLIDSTVDAIGGPLHSLEELHRSGEDKTVYYCCLSYKNLEEALARSPAWISREWLKSRAKQLLPAVFQTQHLNLRGSASNNLFAVEDIRAAVADYGTPLPPAALLQFANGRAYITGAGLDRAYFGSIHGDKTIFTSVAKVAGVDGEEPEYYVLNQKNVLGSLAAGIKKAIVKDVEAYRLKGLVFESYNSQDIYTWAVEMGYAGCELIHPTATAQLEPFMQLYRIVKERRLHFSKDLQELAKEMETFLYELKNARPSFGSDKWNDDRVYSLAWAIHATRQRELASYELTSIVCESKSSHAQHCYLRAGQLILPCSRDCEAHVRVETMYGQHRAARVESDLTLPQFFRQMVKVRGYKVYQGL